MNKHYLIIIILIFFIKSYSQEFSLYEEYYWNLFIINPAVTGAELYTTADLSIRKQWLGFPDAPATYQASGNFKLGKYDFYDPKGFINKGPLKLTDRIGIGASLYKDNNGPLATTGGLISYAYHIPINYLNNLSFGISAIGSYYSFNSSLLKPDQPDDLYLLNDNENKFRANFNLGVYYYNYLYFVGLSANKILPDISQVNEKADINPSYIFIGGYKIMTESNSFNFEPSIAIKKIRSEKIAVDIHAKLYIKRLNWIAISYGTSGKFNFQFGLQLHKMLYAGYNYEFTISEIARYNYGTHEIHLGINLGLVGIKEVRETVNNY